LFGQLQLKTTNKALKSDKKQLAVFTPFNILANNFLPLNVALAGFLAELIKSIMEI